MVRVIVIFTVLGQLLCVIQADARVIRSNGASGGGASARAALWRAVLEVEGPPRLMKEATIPPSILARDQWMDSFMTRRSVIAASEFSNLLRPISEYGDKLRMDAHVIFVQFEFVAFNRAKVTFGTQTAGGHSEQQGTAKWGAGEWTLRLEDVVSIGCGIFGITWVVGD